MLGGIYFLYGKAFRLPLHFALIFDILAPKVSQPEWRNWQTRMVQVHVHASGWRFKSSLGYLRCCFVFAKAVLFRLTASQELLLKLGLDLRPRVSTATPKHAPLQGRIKYFLAGN